MTIKIKSKLFSLIDIIVDEIGHINNFECTINKDTKKYIIELKYKKDNKIINNKYTRRIGFKKSKKLYSKSLKNKIDINNYNSNIKNVNLNNIEKNYDKKIYNLDYEVENKNVDSGYES